MHATHDRTNSGIRCTAAGVFSVILATCGGSPDGNQEPLSAMLSEVSAGRVRTHLTILADDAMQGRETGTEGYLQAARYLASQFAEIGLTPLGDGGSYFQEVAFLSTRLAPESAVFTVYRGASELQLAFPEDFVSFGGYGEADEAVAAPLMFVGYGVHAPQHGHDDFAGVDANGRILVRLTGAPASFPTDERAFYSSSAVKNRFAVERGAVGVVTVRAPVDLPRLPWQRYLAAIGSSDMRWIEPDGTPFEAFPELTGEAVVSEAGAAKLFAFAEQDLEFLFAHHASGGTGSFELDLSASLRRRSVQHPLSAPNVIAKIAGSDPELHNEYLLYTAHLDHLGIRPGKQGDDIHNGAYDNAAGVATILEVARIMAGNPDAIRRSVIFAALAGEEKGLQGSSFLAHNPPVPVERIVAVINIDMPYLGFPIAEIMGLGVEHSTLQSALADAAERTDLEFIPDPRPELVRFIRSDQFSFVKRGVPGLNLKPGARSSDPAVDGAAMLEAYLNDHYHQPGDDLRLPFSGVGSERFTRVALVFGVNVANADQRPAWNEGDFFGARFCRGGCDDGQFLKRGL